MTTDPSLHRTTASQLAAGLRKKTFSATVVVSGRALGQVNLLHEANHYGPRHLPIVRGLVQACIPAFLIADAPPKETSP